MSVMKRRLLSLTLLVAMFFTLAIPASARASDYITRAIVGVTASGNGKISISVKTYATGVMQEVGSLRVVVNEKASDGSYHPVYTFTREENPSMIAKNRQTHSVTLTYQGTAGRDYYITAQCYAKNASGSGATWAGSNTVRA